jgi:hypothetical protein
MKGATAGPRSAQPHWIVASREAVVHPYPPRRPPHPPSERLEMCTLPGPSPVLPLFSADAPNSRTPEFLFPTAYRVCLALRFRRFADSVFRPRISESRILNAAASWNR